MRLFRPFAAVAITSALLLSACGTSEEPNDASDSGSGPDGSETSNAGPVTITDSRGKKVTLPKPAENVVALEWAEAEALVTLGVMPVGVADVKGYSTWVTAAPLDDSVKDVGTRQEPSVDSIVALKPDLIITEAERGAAIIKQLEEYFPVITIRGSDAGRNIELMKENFTTIAKAVGKEDKAKQVLADFDAAVADGRQQLADAGMDGAKFAMADGWMEGGSVAIRMFAQGSLMSEVAERLGLENAWTKKGDKVWGLAQTDVEGLTGLGDIHFFYHAAEEDVFANGLEGNAIWESLPFVEKGNVHKLPDGTWTFGGPLSCQQFIDAVVGTLAS